MDTLVMNGDSIVVYVDKSWEFLDALNFDGVLNTELHHLVTNDTNYLYKQDWNTEMPYTYENDLSAMPDTLWLCTVDSGDGGFCMPFDGQVMSTFKYRGRRFHHGIDIDLEEGDTLRAAFKGRVRYAKYNKSGFGNLVIIRHQNGLETYYAHLSKLMVTPNQDVEAGEVIGLGGKTGRATGTHLHFEVRFYHNALDPEAIIDFKNKCVHDENFFVHKGLFDYKAVSSGKKSSGGSTKPVANKDVKYHKIRSGDSLYSISRKYGTTIDKLCELNGVTRTTILKIGRVLQVRE